MKKLSVTLFLLFVIQQTFFGQSGLSSTNAVPSIVPPTPEAYSIAKFGGNQIGLNTGTVTYSLPLYTLKAGSYSIPISISYNSNGVRVDELPGRVGMQWKMDFAGVVNRTIIGDPDEQPSWKAPTNDTSSALFYSFLHLIGYGAGNGAFQPDQFNYSVPGYSGKFIIDSGGKIIQIPYNNVRITRSLFNNFQVTTPDGIIYNFGNGITETSLNAPGGGDAGTCYPEKLGDPATTAWYLTTIHLPSGDSIKYVYDVASVDSTIKCLTGVNQTYTFQGGLFPSSVTYHYTDPAITTCYQMNEYSYVVLREIQFPSGKVKLFYSSRDDISNEKKMDSLVVMDKNNQVVKKWRFNYTYSNHSGTEFDSPLVGYPSVQYQYPELRKRIFLTSVDDFTGSPALTYQFDYNDIDSLPPRLSYAQDYWGYFNGIVNQFLFPAYTYGGLFTDAGIEYGADRRGNFESSEKGILKRITYPTGGYTDYFYQPGAVAGYLKYKPAFDTTSFSGTVDPTSNLFTSDSFPLSNPHADFMKISIAATAPALDIEGGGGEGLIPDTMIYITIKSAAPGGSVYFTYTGSVWSSYYNAHFPLPATGNYIVTVQSTYPPHVNYSVTIYAPHDTTPTDLPMGGLMVKSLQDNDGMGHIQNRKSFTYGFVAGNPAILHAPYNYSDDEGMFYTFDRGFSDHDAPQTFYGLTRICSNTNYPLYINDFSTIPYPLVTENWVDSSGKVFGGIEHEYLVKDKTAPIAFGFEDVPDSVVHFTKSIVPGTQSSNEDLHNGLELSTRTFKMVDTVKQYVYKTSNIYSVDTSKATIFSDTLYNARLQFDRDVRAVGVNYFVDFDVNRYFIFSSWMHLDTSITKSYSDWGDSITTTTAYRYGNINHLQPTRIYTTNSKGEQVTKINQYPEDFSGTAPYTQMVARNMITPVIDMVDSNTTLTLQLSHNRTNYAFWDDSLILPSTVQSSKNASPLQTDVTFNVYDSAGNILQYKGRDGVNVSFLWDYNHQYPVAKVSNADTGSIAYTSFEADGTGNWVISSLARDSTTPAITGSRSYSLGNGNISKAGLTSGNVYIVSYWSSNGAKTISGGSGSSRTGRTVNGWTYYEHTITASSSTIALSGTGSIDELRLYPQNAQMTTYTYSPLIGLTSSADANSEITYYEYDSFNRLLFVKDYNGNIIRNFKYNFNSALGD